MDKNQINIKKLETYTFSEKEINNIILLNDGRLSLSCWYEGNIFIFDKNFDIEIKFKVRTINYYTQLSNDNLIICGYQKIYIYKIGVKSLQLLEELHEHYDEVFKVIELNNKNLITCAKDVGTHIHIKGGKLETNEPADSRKGTIISVLPVLNLF